MVNKLKSRFKKLWRKPVFKWGGLAVATVLGLLLILQIFSPILFPPERNYNFGTSFSVKRAEEMGLDWKANYSALLSDLKIKHFRLMSYWDEIEPTPGKYDFKNLDFEMDQAAAHDADVSLSIGLRQPRWPECHFPTWVDQNGDWQLSLRNFIKAVVNRYKNHPALKSWQLENEYFNRSFGNCPAPNRQLLESEFKLVKNSSDKPIFMSLSDQHGLPLNKPVPDEFGFSVYRRFWLDLGPWHGYVTYPTPLWYHRLRASLITRFTSKPIFIHELQLEPWGPKDTVFLSKPEQNKSMSLAQIHKNLVFARQIGAKDIYAWGSEWWYWRKVKLHDPSIWDEIKAEIHASERN